MPNGFGRLILLTPLLFAKALTREGLFGATLFTGLHVVAVLFDLLDDVFRLHFAFEAPEGVLQRFTLLNHNFCHAYSPPFPFALSLDTQVQLFYRFAAEPAIMDIF